MVLSHISGETQNFEFWPSCLNLEREISSSQFSPSLYRSLLVSETQRITKVCNEWEEKLLANTHLISEEIQVEAFAVEIELRLRSDGNFQIYSRVQFGQQWVKADWLCQRDSLR